MQFKKFFFSSLSGTITAGILGIVFAVKGFGVWAIVTFALVDQFIDSIVLFITSRWVPTFKINFKETKPLIKFGSNILLAEFVNRGYEQIRLLVIGKAFTEADLAYNGKGQTIPSAIIEITNTSILRVMFPAFSKLQDDKEKMREVASKSIQLSTFILAPAMIGLAAISFRFVPFLYTEKWNMCIPYLQLYCFTYLFHPIQSINLKIIQACGRSDISLIIEIIKKLSGIIFIVVAVLCFDSALFVAASFTAMSVIALVVNSIPCKKLIGYGIGRELLDIIPTLIIASVMGGVVLLIGELQVVDSIAIILQVISGITVYVLLSHVFKLSSYKMLIQYLKDRNLKIQ